ncbi:hypothetical protein B566_EDAN005457 [Ephemera danica]|nr:hypothetical protein B566_EDAN005457 [Ephemera danica]
MSGKRKSVLQTRYVEDDSLLEEDADGHVVAVLYDCNVSSPDSTASGPTYAPRRPGFEHHAHQPKRTETKACGKKSSPAEKTSPPSLQPKQKPKREPLPMKLRALPQSFWQQPNQPTSMSPAFPVLPPLFVQPRGEPGGRDGPEETAHEPLLLSPANTELLFSLFRSVEQDEGPQPPVIRRGRPRKAPSQLMARVLKDDDPCLGSAAGQEALPLPPLPQTTCLQSRILQQQQQQVLNMLSGDRSTLSLPALSGVDHSYSQILSELVIRL